MSVPPDPRLDRFAGLSAGLRWATWTAFALAALGVLLPWGTATIGWVLLAVVAGVPLARTAWFGRRWLSRGDIRYGTVAFAVLAVVATGTLIALLGG